MAARLILLDTNVISEPIARKPSGSVLRWLDRQDGAALHLASPVIAEVSAGAREHLRRTGSARYIRYLERIVAEFDSRILAFTTAEALKFGEVVSRRAAVGRPILPFDAMIAAICLVHGATLATRNVRDFDGLDLPLVNPFEAEA